MAKTVFEDGNILAKIPGTRVLAAWLNKVFSHRHDGRDQDGSAPLDYAVDTGEADALVVTMTPVFDVQTVGLPFLVKVAHTNTGAATLALEAFAAAPIHKLGGINLAAGDLQEGQIVQLAWDGTNYQLLSYNSPPVTDSATLQGHTAHQLVPPGIKGEFFMPTMPDGWLPCDGRAVLRAQYPDLFNAIGTTWGAGDNVSTFNLPEVRGEFFRAWDNGRGVDADRQFASWQDCEVEAHTHTYQKMDYSNNYMDHQSGSAPGNVLDNTGSYGGGETRPRNIPMYVGIKY